MRTWTRINCIGYGIWAITEVFYWPWPTCLSHQIATGVFALYLSLWIAFYLRQKPLGRLLRITAIGTVMAAINLLVSTFWTWWYPPHPDQVLLMLGVSLIGWGVVLTWY